MVLRRRMHGRALLAVGTVVFLVYISLFNGGPSFRTSRFHFADAATDAQANTTALPIGLFDPDWDDPLTPQAKHVEQTGLVKPGPDILPEQSTTSETPAAQTTSIPATNSSEVPLYPIPAPKIQLVVVWNERGSNKKPAYLPNFFASVAANPVLDLLFVRYDREDRRQGCGPPLAPDLANVRELCFGLEDFWQVHADFLCKMWNCDEEQRNSTYELLYKRKDSDPTSSAFKPLRYAVFSKYTNPETKIWGYCDQDLILGNIQRTFPWDIADQFDILTPQPASDSDTYLLFIHGHLVFYSTGAPLLKQLMQYPVLRDFESFLAGPWFGEIADEAEWSFYIMTNKQITFAGFPGLADLRFHLSLAPPDGGVYELRDEWSFKEDSPDGMLPLLSDERSSIVNGLGEHRKLVAEKQEQYGRPTFSHDGSEYEIEVVEGGYNGDLWFEKKYSLHVVKNEDRYRNDLGFGNRFILRRERGGPLLDRQEPHRHIVLNPAHPKEEWEGGHRPYLLEHMYNHFQGEKYKDWWEMPEKGYDSGQIIYVDRERGVEIWDENGEVVWKGSKTLPTSKQDGA